jgi:hypothetical protein
MKNKPKDFMNDGSYIIHQCYDLLVISKRVVDLILIWVSSRYLDYSGLFRSSLLIIWDVTIKSKDHLFPC